MVMDSTLSHYEVTDRSTGKTRKFSTGRAARRWADKRDNEYGCYICTVRAVYVNVGPAQGVARA